MANTYKGKRASQMPADWIEKAVLNLYAYDVGDICGRYADEEMRAFLQNHIASLDVLTRRYVLSAIMRDTMLRADALLKGYGWEDAKALGEWYDETFGVG